MITSLICRTIKKYHKNKEMPNFISTLTKSFILKAKIKEEECNSQELTRTTV